MLSNTGNFLLILSILFTIHRLFFFCCAPILYCPPYFFLLISSKIASTLSWTCIQSLTYLPSPYMGIFFPSKALQIITGIYLSIHYISIISYSFFIIKHIIHDIYNGSLLRYLHSNEASFTFIILYLHIYRSIIFQSYIFLFYYRTILFENQIREIKNDLSYVNFQTYC